MQVLEYGIKYTFYHLRYYYNLSFSKSNSIYTLYKIFRNRKALLMTLSFSLFNGLIASWYSVMNITFRPLPLGDPQDVDGLIGYIGLIAIVANSVTTILVSAVVDRYVESNSGKGHHQGSI